MIIEINDQYRIESDTQCWKVQKFCPSNRKDSKKRSDWRSLYYYNTLESAFQGLLELEIREIEGSDIKLINEKIDEYHSQIKNAMKKFAKIKF